MTDSAKAPSKGAMRAAQTISADVEVRLNAVKTNEQVLAEIIDRETKAGEIAVILRELRDSIEAKADIGKRRAQTVSPRMEEALLRAERLLTELEGKL